MVWQLRIWFRILTDIYGYCHTTLRIRILWVNVIPNLPNNNSDLSSSHRIFIVKTMLKICQTTSFPTRVILVKKKPLLSEWSVSRGTNLINKDIKCLIHSYFFDTLNSVGNDIHFFIQILFNTFSPFNKVVLKHYLFNSIVLELV